MRGGIGVSRVVFWIREGNRERERLASFSASAGPARSMRISSCWRRVEGSVGRVCGMPLGAGGIFMKVVLGGGDVVAIVAVYDVEEVWFGVWMDGLFLVLPWSGEVAMSMWMWMVWKLMSVRWMATLGTWVFIHCSV